MKKMHEQMERMYRAAALSKNPDKRLDPSAKQASLSRLLNVAQQNVHNWEKRGPSKEGVLEAQNELGINATWVLFGRGPMFVGGESTDTRQYGVAEARAAAYGPAWPFGDYSRYESLSEEKKAELARIVDAFLAGADTRTRKSATA